jgi:hypothetical protein
MIVEILQFDGEQRPTIDKILTHAWMLFMRRDIKTELSKLQAETQPSTSYRAKP